MDPLSAAASVIAVVGAAKKVTKGLDLLKAVRGAPQGLSDLLSEVSRLEQVLQTISTALIDSQELLPQLGDVLNEARSKLLELDSLIQYTLTKVGESTKVDRWEWLKKADDVDTLQRQLHAIRQDLIILISTTNLTTSQQVAITTERVSLHQQQTDHLIRQVSARHEAMFAILCEKLEEAPKTLNSLTRMLGNSREATTEKSNTFATTSVEITRNLHRPIDTGPRTVSPNELRLHTLQRINTSRKSCRCSCHHFREAVIPGICSLALQDVSLPYVKSVCNTVSCKCHAAPCIRIRYYLPTWIAYRMICMWFTASPLHGPELVLRVPRVVPNSSPLIKSINEGDLIQFKRLVAEGHGSPYDIDEEGCSFLARTTLYGLSKSRLETAAYLIDIGVEWNDSVTVSSPVHYFNCCTAGVRYDEFKSHLRFLAMVDWDEICEELGFSELHKIVCGFSVRNLKVEARLHPAMLDQIDARGLSPLYYASTFGRADYVHDLLESGSNPNGGMERPLVAAVRSEEYQCIKLLLEYGATTKCLKGYWKVTEGLYKYAKEEEALAIDALLLEYEFDFNCQDYFGRTALMTCSIFPRQQLSRLQNHRIPRQRWLLEVPVNNEVKDYEGKTALHYSIEHSNVMAFEMLINAGARTDVSSLRGSTILHLAILHTSNVNLVQAMRKADLSSVNLEARDDNGYTALDLLTLRARAEWNDHPCHYFHGYPRRARSYRSANSPWVYRWIGVAASPEEEPKIIEALENLLRWIQGSQGVQANDLYPSLRALVEGGEYDQVISHGLASSTAILPGAWPGEED